MTESTQPDRALAAAERVIRGGRTSGDEVYDMAATLLAQRADLIMMKRIIDRYVEAELQRDGP